MVKANIISGFLGAGKTTLIKKLVADTMKGEKVILLENEYGKVGIDGGFMKDSGIQVTEMNSGCICCTLVGDFEKAIDELIEKYNPDRLIIEPSGVGKLSDIRHVVSGAEAKGQLKLSGCVTVVDASKCKMYIKNFGEFFCDQVRSAETIILSRTQMVSQEKLDTCLELLREQNPDARIITTPWDELSADLILETIESPSALINIEDIYEEHHHEHHHHHHHDDDDDEECDDPECECHHHHDDDDDDDEEEHEHHHHHHDDDEHEEHEQHHHHHHHDDDDDDDDDDECDDPECECHHHHDDDDDDDEDEHEHHHHHHHHHHDDDDDDEECDDPECECHHHHHHDADDVFGNIGIETGKKFEEAALRHALDELEHEDEYGTVLRAKGIIPTVDGKWIHFDYTPGEQDIRYGSADYTGRLCVIGCKLKKKAIKELFGI